MTHTVEAIEVQRAEFLESAVGAFESDVKEKVEEGGCRFQVVSRDRNHFISDCVMDRDRVNVVVVDGVVTRAYFG